MKKTLHQYLAVLLILAQLLFLLPMTTVPVWAEENGTDTGSAAEYPVLNKTIVGTVRFQSFNFLGDNETGEDGTDYSTTFYYSDDYFSPSAINDDADSKTMLWSDLENLSLATCSMDLAVASYTSAEGDVVGKSSQTWNNTDYSNKDKNIKQFLGDCGFSNIEPHDLTKRPTNDSIGYTLGSKEITVWNADTQKNETYTLIAVGVRGAGYGAEWASNITIGDPSTGAIPANGRHYGFDHSAQIVCEGIRKYLSSHGISGNVKYWVSGFSRAAAVANLVAGYLTDGGSTYLTQQKDVYGYTWECPQGASTKENALDYKNIHNIINPMDAVPKVSPDAFEHQRLGVDYQMPYHGTPNLSDTQHTALYNQMFEVLKNVAVGNGTDPDPLVDDKDTTSVANDGYVSPSKYPYNKEMTIYKMDGSDLMTQAVGYGLGISDTLMTEFGTVVAEQKRGSGLNARGNVGSLLGWNGGSDYKTTTWYLDDFINNLVTVFLTSDAWVGGAGISRTALENRATFISDYQSDFRLLFGYFLDYTGPAFLSIVPKLIDAVTSNIGSTVTSGFPLAFINFYNNPTETYGKYNYLISSSWRGKAYKDVAIMEAKPIAVKVANTLTANYPDNFNQSHTKAQMNAALEHLVELVLNLYAFERSEYDSQYLGTTLRYLNTILCTHEQETVLSWIMSLDPNHMNRSCRTITIPAGCDATLYEFRPEIEGDLTDDIIPTAPIVAEVKNGVLVSETLKDQRIYSTTSNGKVIIRYPASLQIRADVTAESDFYADSVRVADYRTDAAYTNISGGVNQFQKTTLNASTGYSSVINSSATNVTATNTALSNYGKISAGDTLHILVDDIAAFNEDNPDTYDLTVDKAAVSTIVAYTKADSDLDQGTDFVAAVQLRTETKEDTSMDTSRSIKTRQRTITVPASNVYFDDELTDNSASAYIGNTTRLDQDDAAKTLWYQFRGTRIDLYCTTDSLTGYVMAAVYENNNGERGDRIDIKTIKSSSETPRYNVPTISFDGLDASKEYYLQLYALKGANYRLDGIRVYHPADENDSVVQEVYKVNGEQDAKYVNLRGLLLGSVDEETLHDSNEAGALFYTDSGSSYELTSDEYLADSPKNEIYLQPGQKVAFQIVGKYEKVAVGLSAPESETAGGSVTVTDGNYTKTISDINALDQFYDIIPASNGNVVISNAGSTMIAVTNLKLSGAYTALEASAPNAAPLMVSRSLLRYVSSFSDLPETVSDPEASLEDSEPQVTSEPTAEPVVSQTSEPVEDLDPVTTPEPTEKTKNTVASVVSNLLQRLIQGIRNLFGR